MRSRTLAEQEVADQAVYQRDERLAAAGQNEGLFQLVPVQLEACGEGGDPDLPHGRVGRDHELAFRLLKNHVEHAVLLLDLETGIVVFFKDIQMLFERFQGTLGQTAKLRFIQHGLSVASPRAAPSGEGSHICADNFGFCRQFILVFTGCLPFLHRPAAILPLGLDASSGGEGMGFLRWMAWVLVVAPGLVCAQAQQFQQTIPAAQLVREVVYNELHDHQRHGYWRYWIERHAQKEIRLDEQVETAEGPITRLSLSNGRPLSPESRQVEQERLNQLLSSPKE